MEIVIGNQKKGERQTIDDRPEMINRSQPEQIEWVYGIVDWENVESKFKDKNSIQFDSMFIWRIIKWWRWRPIFKLKCLFNFYFNQSNLNKNTYKSYGNFLSTFILFLFQFALKSNENQRNGTFWCSQRRCIPFLSSTVK